MSLKAMLWALNEAPVDDAQTVLVLIGLADNANEDGTGSWPSVQTLAERARCSPRTVQRHLATLKTLHLIREGNQALVAGYRPDRRPVVYDLNLALKRGDNLTPRAERGDTGDVNGVTPVTERGDTCVTQTVQEPLPGTVQGESPPTPQPLRLVQPDDGFDAFWAAYPRKTAKDAARRAYRSALKRADAATILAGVQRYAADPTRTPQFTAYPATWLNGGRWADEGPAGKTQSGVVRPSEWTGETQW
jgi:hypothetical protein